MATLTITSSSFGGIGAVVQGDVPATLTIDIGVPGPAGVGVPVGGTTGQVLKKASGANYDTVWGTDLAATWGSITGTLSDQTDLQTALNLKADLASPALTGNPTAPTAATGDNDTTIATTGFVQQELAAGTAVAKVLEVEVRNQTGATLTAGTIVYINGATGNKPTVTKAIATGDSTSAQTLGFVKAAIANNGTGKVVVRGLLENIDTSALTEGQQLYLSGTVAGTWQTTKPVAPIHLVYVGIVTRAHPTLGTIEVAIQNGYELDELHDVLIVAPTDGQVLKYDAATSLWKNGTDVGGVAWGGITGTLSNQTDLQTALDGKASLTGATFTGKISATSVSGQAGVNIGIGGTSVDATTPGDLWIPASGTTLNYRDATGSWRQVLTTSQIGIIDTSATNPALRVTQRGTGEAFRVEDSNTPDASAFVISNSGKVGIGVAPDATACLKLDGNGLKFNDGTTQTTALNNDFFNAVWLAQNMLNNVDGYTTGFPSTISFANPIVLELITSFLGDFYLTNGQTTFTPSSWSSPTLQFNDDIGGQTLYAVVKGYHLPGLTYIFNP